jgi:hypothetical protein
LASKALAIAFISGIHSKGLVEPDVMIAFRKIGPGIAISHGIGGINIPAEMA